MIGYVLTAILTFASLPASAGAIGLLRDCSASAERFEVASAGEIKILSSYAGDHTCYSVVVDSESGPVRGFTLDTDLPAIQAFENQRRRSFSTRVIVPAAAAAPQKLVPARPAAGMLPALAPAPLSGPIELSKRDVRGRSMSLSDYHGRGTLLFFLCPEQAESMKLLTRVKSLAYDYRGRAVRVVGIAEAASEGQVHQMDESAPLPFQVVVDDGQFARRMKAPSVPYFILLDGQREIVATGKSLPDIQVAVERLPRP